MNKELTDLAIKFMERLNLTGAEVQAYVAVMNGLHTLKQELESKTTVMPPPTADKK